MSRVYVDACLCASGQMLQHAPWCRGLEECGVPRCSQMRNHFNVKRQEMPSENSLTTCSLFNLRISELTVRIVQVQAANRTGQGVLQDGRQRQCAHCHRALRGRLWRCYFERSPTTARRNADIVTVPMSMYKEHEICALFETLM